MLACVQVVEFELESVCLYGEVHVQMHGVQIIYKSETTACMFGRSCTQGLYKQGHVIGVEILSQEARKYLVKYSTSLD